MRIFYSENSDWGTFGCICADGMQQAAAQEVARCTGARARQLIASGDVIDLSELRSAYEGVYAGTGRNTRHGIAAHELIESMLGAAEALGETYIAAALLEKSAAFDREMYGAE